MSIRALRSFRTISSSSLSFAAAAALTVGACGDDGSTPAQPDAASVDAAPPIDAPTTTAVSIRFAAKVGGAAFSCGGGYAALGTTSATYVGADFRFFISNLALEPTGGGAAVPVALTANANQTADGVALLDFEDATANCQTGNAATYTTVVGTVPTGSYDGVQFDLGIPADRNHLDPSLATAPYNAPGMLWAWQSGHKFAKIDGVVGTAGFNLHLGSTGCPGTSPMQPPTGACANPNRPAIALTGFDPATDTIVADVAPVLAGEDLTTNTPATAPGCMSFPGDPECDTILPRLGVPYGSAPAEAQRLFAVE